MALAHRRLAKVQNSLLVFATKRLKLLHPKNKHFTSSSKASTGCTICENGSLFGDRSLDSSVLFADDVKGESYTCLSMARLATVAVTKNPQAFINRRVVPFAKMAPCLVIAPWTIKSSLRIR